MYKILCHKRDTMRFNQIFQVEEMRFEEIKFAKNAVEILSRIFPEVIFELLDLEEYEKRISESEELM